MQARAAGWLPACLLRTSVRSVRAVRPIDATSPWNRAMPRRRRRRGLRTITATRRRRRLETGKGGASLEKPNVALLGDRSRARMTQGSAPAASSSCGCASLPNRRSLGPSLLSPSNPLLLINTLTHPHTHTHKPMSLKTVAQGVFTFMPARPWQGKGACVSLFLG